MKRKTKTTLRIIAAIVTLASLIIFLPWGWIKLQLRPSAETVQAELDLAIANGFVGIVAYIDKADALPEVYAAGYNNREEKTLMRPETLFKIGSISKLYIAAAITKLVGEGRLSLDQTLNELLPALAADVENAEQITLRMLVQHRSGIPNIVDDSEWSWPAPPQDLEGHYALTVNRGSDFEPDKRYAYSNTNYLFLGAIMDRLLGYSHHQYIQNKILDPLKLNHTYHLMSEAGEENVSSGYYEDWEPDIRNQNYIIPGGSMISTAEEVAIFHRALINGSFFSPEEKALYESLYPYDHTGLLPGYQSIVRFFPEQDMIIVLLMNKSGGNNWIVGEAIYDRIFNIVKSR